MVGSDRDSVFIASENDQIWISRLSYSAWFDVRELFLFNNYLGCGDLSHYNSLKNNNNELH